MGQVKQLLVFISAFAPAEDGAIHAYRLDVGSGGLTLVRKNSDVEHPFFLALSSDDKFLYSIHAPGQFGVKKNEYVSAFEVIGNDGELKLLNRQSTRGAASCYLDVDEMGKSVVVANYMTGSVGSFAVRDDGSLSETMAFVQHHGSSVDPSRQSEPHAHCIVISPDNRFAYVADLGLDQVVGYRLDTDTAKLLSHRQPFVRTSPGVGPRHLTFHPNGRWLYVINEMGNSVTRFDYDAQSGMLIEQATLSTLPKDFEGTSHCADLKVTPDGRFLYGTNRGHDSIVAYRIEETGELTWLGTESSQGSSPQNLAIVPGGELLLCANMVGNNVVVFRIDAKTGSLSSIGQPLSIISPSCIMIR